MWRQSGMRESRQSIPPAQAVQLKARRAAGIEMVVEGRAFRGVSESVSVGCHGVVLKAVVGAAADADHGLEYKTVAPDSLVRRTENRPKEPPSAVVWNEPRQPASRGGRH